MRDVRQMRGQSSKRHRPRVRLPRQLVVGQPLEQPARDPHLMIVVGEQSVLDGHNGSLKRIACAAALALLLVFASPGCRRAPPPPPLVADVSGTRELAGLSAPVRVVRDRWGVPHIYAQSEDDLFFAQG